MTLLWILGGLAIALVLMVWLTARISKTIDVSQQQNLSRWLVILIVILLVARIVQHYFGG